MRKFVSLALLAVMVPASAFSAKEPMLINFTSKMSLTHDQVLSIRKQAHDYQYAMDHRQLPPATTKGGKTLDAQQRDEIAIQQVVETYLFPFLKNSSKFSPDQLKALTAMGSDLHGLFNTAVEANTIFQKLALDSDEQKRLQSYQDLITKTLAALDSDKSPAGLAKKDARAKEFVDNELWRMEKILTPTQLATFKQLTK